MIDTDARVPVLLVEDQEVLAGALRTYMIRMLPVDVEHVGTLADGLIAWKARHHHIVLLDLMLPDSQDSFWTWCVMRATVAGEAHVICITGYPPGKQAQQIIARLSHPMILKSTIEKPGGRKVHFHEQVRDIVFGLLHKPPEASPEQEAELRDYILETAVRVARTNRFVDEVLGRFQGRHHGP